VRTLPLVAMSVALLSCRTAGLPSQTAAPDGSSAVQAGALPFTPVLGLSAISCEGPDCLAQVNGRLHSLQWPALALGPDLGAVNGVLVDTTGGARVLVDCAEPAPLRLCTTDTGGAAPAQLAALAPDQGPSPKALELRWNTRQAAGWRVGFSSRIPTPEGGTISWMRGAPPLGARLMRTGAAARVAAAPGPSPVAAYPGVLALHPSGVELYALTWPGGTLAALDPRTLERRWTLALSPAAHPLFVDAGGRWLVAEVGGQVPDDLLLDLAGTPAVPVDWDPAGDAALRLAERPAASRTAVVDLATQTVLAELPGRFVGFHVVPGQGALVATTDGLASIAAAPRAAR
jgi:hypothetical protein